MSGLRPGDARGLAPWVVVAGACLAVFLVDLLLVVSGTTGPADRQLDLQLHSEFGSGTDPFFSAVSNLAAGQLGTAIMLVVAIGLLVSRRLLPAVLVVLAISGAAVLDAVVKELVHRARPELFHHAVHASGYSFPSGHSTNTFAFFAVLIFLLIWFRVDRRLIVLALVVSVIATLLVGLSRITLGVHYPTDVLGGYALSGAWCISVFTLLPARLRLSSAR